ncbi:MAG: Crp/Fnr family transcriptional regulator [Burkholderiaceae bacterium]
MSTTTTQSGAAVSTPVCERCATRMTCLFTSGSAQVNASLRPHIVERVYRPGDVIKSQGSNTRTVRVIKLGLVRADRSNSDSDARPIMLLGRSRVLGLPSLLDLAEMSTAIAMTPVRLCEVNSDMVKELSWQHEDFRTQLFDRGRDYLDCMADWSRVMREESPLSILCVALRIIAQEERSPTFRIPRHAELAALLGFRRETVVRQLAALMELDVIRKIDRWHGMLTGKKCHAASPDENGCTSQLSKRIALDHKPAQLSVHRALGIAFNAPDATTPSGSSAAPRLSTHEDKATAL